MAAEQTVGLELGPWAEAEVVASQGSPMGAEAEASYVVGLPVPLPLPPGPPVRLD